MWLEIAQDASKQSDPEGAGGGEGGRCEIKCCNNNAGKCERVCLRVCVCESVTQNI